LISTNAWKISRDTTRQVGADVGASFPGALDETVVDIRCDVTFFRDVGASVIVATGVIIGALVLRFEVGRCDGFDVGTKPSALLKIIIRMTVIDVAVEDRKLVE
jgi:hypothetical protein